MPDPISTAHSSPPIPNTRPQEARGFLARMKRCSNSCSLPSTLLIIGAAVGIVLIGGIALIALGTPVLGLSLCIAAEALILTAIIVTELIKVYKSRYSFSYDVTDPSAPVTPSLSSHDNKAARQNNKKRSKAINPPRQNERNLPTTSRGKRTLFSSNIAVEHKKSTPSVRSTPYHTNPCFIHDNATLANKRKINFNPTQPTAASTANVNRRTRQHSAAMPQLYFDEDTCTSISIKELKRSRRV